MWTWIRKHKITSLLLFAVLYLLLGATVPFFRYKKVREETRKQLDVSEFRQHAPGAERVALVETNQSAWEERMRLLSRAENRIILSTFDMRPGESTKDILAVLLHKANEGVKVQILVDGISGAIRMEGQELFYAVSSHPNMELKIYNPLNLLKPWKLQGRMHDKYVIVDEKAYLLGGRNTFDYFIGSYTKKNVSFDREVLVYNTRPGNPDTSLWELTRYFESVWNQKDCTYFHQDEALNRKPKVQEQTAMLEKRYQKLTEEYPELFEGEWDYEAHTCEAGSIRLISNPTHVMGKEPELFYRLTELMKQAENRVVIQSPYVVCNGDMYQALAEVKQEVPDIRILLNSVENGDNFVASSDYLRNKGKILETGITLYEYDGGTSNHGKSVLIDDDLSLVGSYNLDLRSTYLDTELMLVIESKELNRELSGYMEDMERDSRLVLDEKTYQTPEYLSVAEVPGWKRMAWKVVGFLLQPFRCLI